MAIDAFLKLGDGTKVGGESTQAGHAGEIEVLGFSLGTDDPHTPERSGIPVVRGQRSAILPLHITKRIDKASPILFLMSAQGAQLDTAVLTVRRKGAVPFDYLVYSFRGVTVDVVDTRGSTDAGGDPTETVTFNFSSIQIKYIPQNADGTPGTPVQVGYERHR